MANKAKPSSTRKLEGNRGKRPINESEPVYSAKRVKCPAHLHEYAKAEWKRLAPALVTNGLLDEGSLQAFAIYCSHVADEQVYREGLATIRAEVLKVKPNDPMRFDLVKFPSGAIQQHPLVGMINGKAELARKMLIEFGFTPSSRAKVIVPPADEAKPDGLAAHNAAVARGLMN